LFLIFNPVAPKEKRDQLTSKKKKEKRRKERIQKK